MTYEYIVAFYDTSYNRWSPFGDITSNLNYAKEDLDYFRSRRPEMLYCILRREVSEWTVLPDDYGE